jgi:glycosyltransferase involved in cell wall biosynthesis
MTDLTGQTIGWLGNARYSQPLSLTDARKWWTLASLGADIVVIAFSSDRHFHRFSAGPRFILLPELPGAPLRYLELAVGGLLLTLWLIFRRGARIVVAQSPYEGAVGALAKSITRRFGKQVALVVESHGDFEESLFSQRRIAFAGLYRRLMRRAAAYGLRHADGLRAVSISAEQQLQSWRPGKPVHRFMAWIDAQAFGDTPRLQPLADSHDFVYAGVLIPRKGVHTLLDAFARIAPDFPASRLWLVGKPENADYAAQLHQQALRLGLDSRVIFVGVVSQQELAGYMARARALVLASSSEGLPRVVVEAMLNGLVVVATRVSGIPEVIDDGITGYLVPPGDVETLAAALRTVLLDPDIDAMGARARDFARRFFSPAAYLDGYRKLLANALEL